MGYLSKADLDVLIIGAGPTGLAMAAEAARFGLRYRIVDKALAGARYSQALVVQARTLEQFERYEIAQRAIECGRRMRRIRIYSEGKRVLEASFEGIPGNYPFVLLLPQNETERLLAEHVESQGSAIERDVALESFVDGLDAVECVLLHGDGTRETLTAAYLIGADGAHSTVRRLLGIPFEGVSVGFDFFLGDLRVVGDVPGDELTLYLHEGNVLFMGRLDETHCRFIVTLREQPADREPQLSDFQNVIDMFGIENLRVSDPRWMAAFRVNERTASAYSQGRIFLAGDATNVHSPVGGQGMNTGIQDAANLLWKLALVERGRAQSDLLESYDSERKPLGDALLRETAVALRAATASNWLLARIRDQLLQHIASLEVFQDRFRETVSELGIHYRGSPIVVDCGGRSSLHAGDRAPDCEVVDETATRFRIFELLKEPTHTALMVTPPDKSDASRLADVLARYRDVMQGTVLTDGDEEFRSKYAHAEGVLYVIRPDGYIGFRSRASDIPALEDWCTSLFLEPTLSS